MEFLKLSRVKIFNLLLLGLLGGCTILSPYVDRRRNPGTSDVRYLYTGRSTPTNPAVCYNSLISSDERLQQLADAECVKHKTGTHAVFVKKDGFACKLFLPSVAYYKCQK